MSATVIIRTPADRARAKHWCEIAPEKTTVVFKKPRRTESQNDLMWVLLTDVAMQAVHNGKRWTADQWKQLFMNACGHESHFMPGLNGEPFPAGFRSSKLSKEQMTELIDFIDAWGTQNGVKWTDKDA